MLPRKPMQTFEEVFRAAPSAMAGAPGRVNLLGEHTDYNGGFVLPTAITQKTGVMLRPNSSNLFRVYAASMNTLVEFNLTKPPEAHFASYIYGCLREVNKLGHKIPALDIYIHSTVPMEVGLSSSAALEVAMLRALRLQFNLNLSDILIAKMAQQAEIKYAKVNCGIMDQMASSLADSEHMLSLDTRTLETEMLPLTDDSEILVLDSGISRSLATSQYNERRLECHNAAKLLQVAELRDVIDISALEKLPEPLVKRARHVVSEINRVLQARKGVSAQALGQLMNASHQSLKEDYQVSIPELDFIVALLQENVDLFDAKLTGAGFGGACVALCKARSALHVSKAVLKKYNAAGNNGQLIVPIVESTKTT